MIGTAAVPRVGAIGRPNRAVSMSQVSLNAAPRARAALKTQAVPHARVERDVHAVPVVRFVTKVIGGRVVRVGGAKGAPRVACEERDRIAAAVGQERILGRGERDLVVVGRRERAVVGDEEVAPDPAVVGDLHRDLRRDLLLHADADLPIAIARAPTLEDRRIDGRGLR